ncbi:MAG: DUF2934 domain-containing protein [Oligoflexia bacterium]|nr:DUF2934 domain-containing protein [Oligoflexia bacterium]
MAKTGKTATVAVGSDESQAATRPSRKEITPEVRHQMIRETAYYIAERRGFQGSPQQDWYEAEQEINRRLRS